jgi:hypothetical protein
MPSKRHTGVNLDNAILTRAQQQKKKKEPSNFKNWQIFGKFLALI